MVSDCVRIVDVAFSATTPYTSATINHPKYHNAHSWEVSGDAGVTAASVSVYVRLKASTDFVGIGNTVASPLTLAGDKLFQIDGLAIEETRVVVNSITGTSGNLRVVYRGL